MEKSSSASIIIFYFLFICLSQTTIFPLIFLTSKDFSPIDILNPQSMPQIWKCSWRRKQPEFSAHLWMTLPQWSFSSSSFICINSSLITFIWTFILSTFILLATVRLMICHYLFSTWKWKKIMLLCHILFLHWL